MSADTASTPERLAPAPVDREPPDDSRTGASHNWSRRLRPHRPVIVLVGLGAVLRLLFMVAYQPAFWFHGDSGQYVGLSAEGWALTPHPQRPLGYVLFLMALRPTGTHLAVVAAQHLLGLALAGTVYALLQRRGVGRWVSALAVTPLLFDPLAVTLEHYLLGDTLFTVFLATAIVAVLWSPVPDYRAVASAGALLAAAWFTKPTALPVAALVGLYLLVRRVGWRRVTGYLVAFLIPYLAALLWIGDRPSVYGDQSTTALYGRTAMIADCAHLDLTPTQRLGCPDQPLGHRWDRADAFYWIRPARLRGPDSPQVMTSFAIEVIRQQPLDYLSIVGRESLAHFVPGIHLGPMTECLRERLVPPTQFHDSKQARDRCPPSQASRGFRAGAADPTRGPVATPLTRALHGYGEVGRVGPIVLSIALLLVLAALARGRRVAARLRLDGVLLLAAGPGLTVLTVAVGMYEPRYAMPAMPLAAIAAGLAWHGLRTPPPEPAQDPPDPPDLQDEPGSGTRQAS